MATTRRMGRMSLTGALLASWVLIGCSSPAPTPPPVRPTTAPGTPTAAIPTVAPTAPVTQLAMPTKLSGELCRVIGNGDQWSTSCPGTVGATGYDIAIECIGTGQLSYVVADRQGRELSSASLGCGVPIRNTALVPGEVKAGDRIQLTVTPSGSVTVGYAVIFPVSADN